MATVVFSFQSFKYFANGKEKNLQNFPLVQRKRHQIEPIANMLTLSFSLEYVCVCVCVCTLIYIMGIYKLEFISCSLSNNKLVIMLLVRQRILLASFLICCNCKGHRNNDDHLEWGYIRGYLIASLSCTLTNGSSMYITGCHT